MTTESRSDGDDRQIDVSDKGRVRTRRAVVGSVAGIGPGFVLASIIDPQLLGLVLGTFLGILYGLAFRSRGGSALDHAISTAALSIPAWALVQVVGLALVRDGRPAWTVNGMTALLPSLTTWMIAGTLFGMSVPLVSYVLEGRYGRVIPDQPEPAVEDRIVVLGGGFAGLSVAQRLEERFGPDPTVELTLVNETNAILFTPLLAEVAGGSIEPTHVTTPLRTSLLRTRVIQAEATDVDIDERTVHLELNEPVGANLRRSGKRNESEQAIGDGAADGETVSYDHLVVALGSVPNYRDLGDVREFAFDFKTLQDAMEIRNHVIACFERADQESDPSTREALLTFLVAGAGFAGAELAGALNDFVHGLVVHFPNVPPEEVTVVVAHSRERIMPELSEPLAQYALERMRDRGVVFQLETYVTGADIESGVVTLSNGEPIRTETLIWTAGNRPNPLIEQLDIAQEGPGAIRVDPFLSVPDREGIWAAGDCAAVPHPITGDYHPATAEHAVRAGQVLADNVYASITDEPKRRLEYQSPGSLAVIGYQTACAELWGQRFSGLFAWMLWRAVYLSKLPGTDRKIRVLVDWLLELVFPRDIVQTMGGDQRRGGGDAK